MQAAHDGLRVGHEGGGHVHIGQHGTHHTAPGIQYVQHALQFRLHAGLDIGGGIRPLAQGLAQRTFRQAQGLVQAGGNIRQRLFGQAAAGGGPEKGVVRDGFHCLKGHGGVVVPLRAVLYLPAAHGHGEAAENGMDQLARSSLLEGGHQGLDPALIGHAPKNGGHGDDAGLAAQVLHLGPGAVRVFMDAQGLFAPVFHALHFKGDAPEGGVL